MSENVYVLHVFLEGVKRLSAIAYDQTHELVEQVKHALPPEQLERLRTGVIETLNSSKEKIPPVIGDTLSNAMESLPELTHWIYGIGILVSHMATVISKLSK